MLEAPESPDSEPGATPKAVIFKVWFLIGVQSWGGGATTISLIRRAAIDKYRWIDNADFNRAWALSQIVPGVNLIALTLLIGRRAGGNAGIVLSLLGLVLPAALITAALTAAYASVSRDVFVQHALAGAIPATVGIGLVTAYQIGNSTHSEAKKANAGWMVIALAVVSAAAATINRISVVAILLACGGIGAIHAAVAARGKRGEPA